MENICKNCKNRFNRCVKLNKEVNRVEEVGEFVSKYQELNMDTFDYVASKYSCNLFKASIEHCGVSISEFKKNRNKTEDMADLVGKEILIDGKYNGIIVGPIIGRVLTSIDKDQALNIEVDDLFHVADLDRNLILELDNIEYTVK